jgi:hypothetical protein
MQEQRQLTFGEKACGVSFNPGGLESVNQIKKQFADVVDSLNDYRNASTNPEVKRMLSVAITEAQTAQMWAVKAVTWQY